MSFLSFCLPDERTVFLVLTLFALSFGLLKEMLVTLAAKCFTMFTIVCFSEVQRAGVLLRAERHCSLGFIATSIRFAQSVVM